MNQPLKFLFIRSSLIPHPSSFLNNHRYPFAFGGDFDFATSFADVFILILQLQPNVNANEVGLDNDTMIFVDNVKFEGAFASSSPGGDYDGDGDADGNDFLVWQRGESPDRADDSPRQRRR